TVVAVAAEKNSTLVLPFPVELLRFLERAQQGGQAPAPPERQPERARETPPPPDGRQGAGPDRATRLPEGLGVPDAFGGTDGLGIPGAFGDLEVPGALPESREPEAAAGHEERDDLRERPLD
ncbi:slipin family protein, partial [Streptomyces sp. NPDC048566]